MNTGRPKGNQKHLDLSARIIIEQHSNNGDSFRNIAIELSKDPSTISKEVRRHSIIRERSADAFAPIPCANNYNSSKPRTTKGTSFEKMTGKTTLLLLNHINSEKRDSLNGHSPYEVSRLLLDNRLHKALGLAEIPADEVTLIPALIK